MLVKFLSSGIKRIGLLLSLLDKCLKIFFDKKYIFDSLKCIITEKYDSFWRTFTVLVDEHFFIIYIKKELLRSKRNIEKPKSTLISI